MPTCSARKYADVYTGKRHWNELAGRQPASATPGPSRPTCAVRRSSTACRREAPGVGTHRQAPAAWSGSATASPRTTSPPPVRSPPRVPRGATCRSTPWSAGLQLLRLTPGQPRGDDARHLRQRAPQEPAGTGHGRQLDDLPARPAADVDLRCLGALPGKGTRPLVILAGKEYGTGSSRDWAAKGPALLGVRP
jgi:hypothetical protein